MGEFTNKTPTQLEESVAKVIEPWAESPYYEDAEKWTFVFWDETTHFRRLFDKLNLATVVELACGHGRHSEWVARVCGRLTLVDVFQSNLDVCATRLRRFSNVEYVKGNGYSFAPVPDDSTTSIFCYDAMVHFSPEIVQSYLKDAARILQPGGLMLLHHSNYDAPTDQHYGLNPNARNHMTRRLFAQFSDEAGLTLEEQIIIPWGGNEGLDGLSLLRKP